MRMVKEEKKKCRFSTFRTGVAFFSRMCRFLTVVKLSTFRTGVVRKCADA